MGVLSLIDKINIMNAKERIQEFIYSLKEEINYLKKGKGNNVVNIFKGQFIRETGGFFVYKFKIENPLIIMDDTPAEFVFRTKRFKCQIVSVQGTTILVGIEQSLGNTIPEAKLETNMWYLLELLQKKFDSSINSSLEEFKLPEDLFNGNSIKTTNLTPSYVSNPEKPPNESQIQAIEKAVKNSLSIIWGPPGTGKTTTIAYIVQALLNQNKRILLVSHANAAVDGALEDVAMQMKDTIFYNDGKLVRLGLHRKESLENYPLVILDQIESKFGKSLVEERKELQNKILPLTKSLESIIEIRSNIDLLNRFKMEINNQKNIIVRFKTELEDCISNISQAEKNLNKNKLDLSEAYQAGALKKFFKGLDPDYIKATIVRLKSRILEFNQNKVTTRERVKEEENVLRNKIEEHDKIVVTTKELVSDHNIDINELSDNESKLSLKINELKDKISQINKSLEELRKKILSEAKLVATTLTKTFSSREFPDFKFDTIIIDESSMAPMPFLYWATSKAKETIALVGDFLQLPPINSSNGEYAKKWLKRSIYDELEINLSSTENNNIVLLEEQYRMHPNISKISNELFYESRLKDSSIVVNNFHNDKISNDHSLVIIDSSDKNPWCSQISTGGRFNIYNAFLTAKTAKKLYEENPNFKYGIITPYRAQVRLITKILKDWNFEHNFEISTTHSFQGGEKRVIIIDSVESPGGKSWSMLQDADGAEKLLNVAFTRAKDKIFLVVNINYIESVFPTNAIFRKILSFFDKDGIKVKSREIIDEEDFLVSVSNFVDEDTVESLNKSVLESSIYSEKDFWTTFNQDLINCQDKLIIVSPFTSTNRIGKLMNYFTSLVNKGVEVKVFIRPPNNQGGSLTEHAEESIKLFNKWGVKVIQKKNIHQKIAIIDNKITWEGSLNILSHNNTIEHMRRLKGENTAIEIIRNLDLDSKDGIDNILEDICPECQAKGITSNLVIKKSKYGKFKGCSAFPKCRYIEKKNRSRY